MLTQFLECLELSRKMKLKGTCFICLPLKLIFFEDSCFEHEGEGGGAEEKKKKKGRKLNSPIKEL